LWYYVYGTSTLALDVGAILMLVDDPHIACVFVELQLFYELQLCRTQVYFQNLGVFSELESGTRLHLCTGLELWESETQMHRT
jgi:hypothetical protein